jgi:hypothetical protein
VPPDDRFGRDQDQVPAPVAPSAAGQLPEELVAGAQAWALARRSREDGELLAEQDVLGDQVTAAPDDRPEEGDEQQQVLTHCRP